MTSDSYISNHILSKLSVCAKEQFRKFLTVSNNELFTRCSTPWLGNMTYGLIEGYEFQEPCNISDATAQSVTITDFMFKSASFAFEECQSINLFGFSNLEYIEFASLKYTVLFTLILFVVPCEVASYKMQTTEYDADSLITVHMNSLLKTLLQVSVPNNTKTYSLMVSFLKTEIDLSEEISLNQFSDLISSVGGNLGLFTGFSFLGVLLTLIEWKQKMLTRFKK